MSKCVILWRLIGELNGRRFPQAGGNAFHVKKTEVRQQSNDKADVALLAPLLQILHFPQAGGTVCFMLMR
jgi:hypothetical protein